MELLVILGLLVGAGSIAALIDDDNDNDNDNDDTFSEERPEEETISNDGRNIIGTSDADTIDGRLVADTINGRDGDDTISASGGRDVVFGREGEDLIVGGNSSDVLWGGTESDTVIGGAGNDLIQGNADADLLIGIDIGLNDQSAGELDALNQPGAFDLLGVAGLDLPAPGADTHGADTLLGGSGDDTLFLGGGDIATGGDGGDSFITGEWMPAGQETVITDFDPSTEILSYVYTETAGPTPEVTITEDVDGNATVSIDGTPIAVLLGPLGTVTTDNVMLVLRPGPEETGGGTEEPEDPRLGDDLNSIVGTDGADAIRARIVGDQILGRGGDDTIAASGGRDEVFAGAGNDLVAGGNGSDVLWGGPGDDTLLGGEGGDLLRGTAGNDLLFGVELGFENTFAEALAAALPASAPDLPTSYDLPRTVVEDGQWRDVLEGGSGDDALVLGARDTGTGGLGADGFWIGEWGQGGESAALITDYDPTEDRILYVHTAASDGEALPVLTFGTTEAGDGTILADGQLVAVVAGAGSTLSAADVGIVTRAATAA
jgi:Ca2+-binding RTX toxin-like protein